MPSSLQAPESGAFESLPSPTLSQPPTAQTVSNIRHPQTRLEGVLESFSSEPTQAPTSTQRPAIPTFPARLQRQRTSNITVENPELEFQKTALNTCRSTIAQQESEIKRQKEALDIRNKRILQLEAHVDHASEFVAARDITNPGTSAKLDSVLSKIEILENKISNVQPQLASCPTNTIVINSCKTDHNTPVILKSSSTQTEEVTLEGNDVNVQTGPEESLPAQTL